MSSGENFSKRIDSTTRECEFRLASYSDVHRILPRSNRKAVAEDSLLVADRSYVEGPLRCRSTRMTASPQPSSARRSALTDPGLPQGYWKPGRRKADPERQCSPYSMTRSARSNMDRGTLMPSDFAALTLTTNSNVVACSIGKSAGLAPLKILST